MTFKPWHSLRSVVAASALALMSASAYAQDFSALSCPSLAELRMEMLVRFGFCPADRYYLQLYRSAVPHCDPALGEFQVEDRILSGRARDVLTGRPPEQGDITRLTAVLAQLQRKNCDF